MICACWDMHANQHLEIAFFDGVVGAGRYTISISISGRHTSLGVLYLSRSQRDRRAGCSAASLLRTACRWRKTLGSTRAKRTTQNWPFSVFFVVQSEVFGDWFNCDFSVSTFHLTLALQVLYVDLCTLGTLSLHNVNPPRCNSVWFWGFKPPSSDTSFWRSRDPNIQGTGRSHVTSKASDRLWTSATTRSMPMGCT